jgi:hypothetical protein
MSRLPQLERDLVEAAGRGRRRRMAGLVPRIVRPALVVALLVGVVVGIGMAAGAGDPEREVGAGGLQRVPEATFERSERLTRAETPREDADARVPLRDFLSAVARVRDQTPYPPGRPDDFDWENTPEDPRDMGSIRTLPAIQMVMEFRARCHWLRYWLDARTAGNAGVRGDAERIIHDIPAWPTLRNSLPGDAALEAVEAGDEARVRRDIGVNCGASPDPVAGYEAAPPERGSKYTVEPRTLAQHGDLYAVVGYEAVFSGTEPTLCLDLRFLGEGSGTGCHSATERAQGTSGGMRTGYAIGATTEDVDAIEVRYRDGAEEGVSQAVLLRADRREALAPLRLEPFTFYLAELPRGGKPVEATAMRDGAVVWRAAFP